MDLLTRRGVVTGKSIPVVPKSTFIITGANWKGHLLFEDPVYTIPSCNTINYW